MVDDEVGIRELLSEILSDEGHQVHLACNAEEAKTKRSSFRPELVLLDIWMPDTDGITLLKEWASKGLLTMPVVMMSGHGTIETAVEATRIGAYAFLEKPIALQKLLSTVGKALSQPKKASGLSANVALAALGATPAITDLRVRLERARTLTIPVLFLAEPGSGEDICARFLHRENTRWFTAKEILSGSGSGDLRLSPASSGGTLFLDRVDELTQDQQRMLVRRLASVVGSDVRIISTAREDLPKRLANGAFDAHLYGIISGITLRIPTLREHADDVPAIASYILGRLIELGEAPVTTFTTAALNAMRLNSWPGNLSELESVVKTSALLAANNEIGLQDVFSAMGRPDNSVNPEMGTMTLDATLRDARDAFERAYFEYHIAREGGNMSRLAERVGLERTHLYRKLKQLGVGLPRRLAP